MTNTVETTKEPTKKTTSKTKATKAQEPKAETAPAAKAKTPKPAKEGKAGGEPADRLPTTIEQLKATKGGLACYLFLSGKEKVEIAKELKTAFGLGDNQAVKIVRRMSGRARFFRRQIEHLAHGFFRGPESFRQEIRQGHLTLPLQQLKDLPDDPDGCSQIERLFLADLEQAQKVWLRLMTKSPDERLSSRPFRAQAHLLCAGLLSRLPAFTQTLQTLYDRCGQT